MKISKIAGVDMMRYSAQVKGIGMSARSIRSRKCYPTNLISYAVSVQGGGYMSVVRFQVFSPHGELKSIFDVSTVIYSSTSWTWSKGFVEFLDSVTGWNAAGEMAWGDDIGSLSHAEKNI